VLAAFASAGTFAVGAALPLVVVLIASANILAVSVVGTSLASLAILGALAPRVAGAMSLSLASRVTFWGALAMAITYGVGALFGTVV